MKLTPKERKRLWDHYTGNCVFCTRCALYERIERGDQGAVEEYVVYMREEHGEKVEVLPK